MASAQTNVAKIGTTEYATLQGAFDAATDGETVTLLDNVTLSGNLELALEGKSVTLDLGTKTLIGRTNLKSGNLTVKNGTVNCEGGQPLNVYGSATAGAENYSVLTVAENVTVSGAYGVCLFGPTYAAKAGYGAVINVAGTLNGTSGTVFVSGNLGNNIAGDMNNVVNITGKVNGNDNAGVALNGNATVNVKSGAAITGNTGIAIKRGVLNVEDGATVHATGAENLNPDPNNNGTEMTGAAISMTDTYNHYGAMSVNITGGTFTSDNTVALFKEDGTYENAATYAVSGGTFSSAVPAEFCAEGYIPADLGAGKFSVKVGSYVAQIGNSKFETLQAAVDAAEAGATIEILKDFTLTTVTTSPSNKYNVNVNKSVTINGNGHILTSAEGKRAIVLQGAGNNVVLKDITVKSNNAEACLWIADAVNVTLDNSTLDGTKGKTYNQPLTIGKFDSESRVALNVINGSVIKTNDAGTAHYDIIAWHPAEITVTDSELKGWAAIYFKSAATGSTATVENSTLTSKNPYSGNSNSFGVFSIEATNVTVDVTNSTIDIDGVSNKQAIVNYGTTYGDCTGSMVNLREGNKVTLKNQATFTINQGDTYKLQVSGGLFSEQVPEENCAEGIIPTANTDEATSATYPYTVKEGSYVAQIEGGAKYETLQEAIAAATAGQTITLLADIDATEQIEVGKQVTLDLNGKTIEYKSEATLTSGVIMVLRGGDLTVTDSSEGATGAIKSGTKAYAAIALTKKGETSTETAKLTVNNGTLEGYYYAITGNGSRHGTEITIAGGTVKGTNEKSNQGIYHPQDGTLTISGGTISGYSSAVELRAGTLNITGGTLSASCTDFNYQPNQSGTTTAGAVVAIAQHSTLKAINVSIKGATLEGAKTIAVTDAQNNNLKDITVSVADALTEKAYIPEGFKWVSADGMSTLTKKEYVAQVGDVKYETLREALDAAKDNENIVVELLADATLDITAWSGTKNPLAIGTESTKSITINGNSHTLTFNQKNSDWNNIATMNDDVTKLVLNNMAITNSGYDNGTWNSHDINFNCAVELNNVTSDKALAFKNDASLKNVTVTETGDVYAIWVQPHGQNISIDGLTINAANGRGIKIDDQYVDDPGMVTLGIANATFNTKNKSAILVKSAANTVITAGEGINIENVASDKENLVWVDEDRAEEFYKVTVAGATVVPESKVSDYVACVMNGEQRWGFYKKLSDAVNNVEEGYSIKLHQTTAEAVEVSKALTITKNGFTADKVTAGEGFKKFETETEIVIKSFNPVCAIGDEKYESLQEAINACESGAETTIKLLVDVEDGSAFEIADSKKNANLNIIIDFDNHSYNVTKNAVGSARTKSQAMHFASGNTLTLKNGTISSAATSEENNLKMMMQNYCDLTLDGMTIDCSNINGGTYPDYSGTTYEYWSLKSVPVFNFNTGNATIKNTTISFRDGDNVGLCVDGGTVALGEGVVVNGAVSAVSGSVTITDGKYSGAVTADQATLMISGGVYTKVPADEYCADGFVVTENTDDATKKQYPYTVKSKEEAGIYELIHDVPYKYVDGVENAEKITYTRTFESRMVNNFQTWYVPFDYTITEKDLENFKFYKIHLISAAGKMGGEVKDKSAIYIYVQEVAAGTKLAGNRPYVLKPKSELKDFVFEVNNTKLYAKDESSRLHVETTDFNYDFYGNYDNFGGQPTNAYYTLSKDGELRPNGATVTLKSYRWYIKVTPRNDNIDYAKPNIYIVEGDGETDGINNAQTTEAEIEGIYTLGGIKVEHLVKGVNIIKYTDGRTKKINVK